MLENRRHEPVPTTPQAKRRSEVAIDLVHLAAQCRGDKDLEHELLRLFRIQVLDALRELPASLVDPEGHVGALAHKLRGSALAVGAGRMARAAGRVEALAREATRNTETETRATDEFEASLREAVAEIDRLQA